jgi:hypothetical protein
MDAGYSTRSLTDKLGLKPGQRACFTGAPDGYVASLALLDIELLIIPTDGLDFAQVFATQGDALKASLQEILSLLKRDGTIWVSWPKKSAAKKLGIETDLTEDVIRDIALPMGLVDVKVCAVNDIWSGLKLVIRKELR